MKSNKAITDCCMAMHEAIERGYLYTPIQMVKEMNNGKSSMTMKAMSPAIEGPTLKPNGRKRAPSLILSYCPWCRAKLK